MKTQKDIDAVAQRTQDAGVPDHLNRWLGMTPELLAESEARIARHIAGDQNRRSADMPKATGTKEAALRAARENEVTTADAGTVSAKKPRVKAPATNAAPASKKAAPNARAPVQAEKTASAGRPAEKQVIIKKLLARKNGCTAKEVMAACNWPSVSMPQQAKALDIELFKSKKEGEPTRYADHALD